MWPLQQNCDAFYGNPRGPNDHADAAWEAANLTRVIPPFKLYYAGKLVGSVKIHRKCADSLARVFAAIWVASGKSQAKIDEWGVSLFGGSYNFRLMRGSSHLSMHSYGCAIDLAPERFPMGSHAHLFAPEVIKAFADEGWQNLPNDRMHFQAARVTGLSIPIAPRAAKTQTPPQRVPNPPTINLKAAPMKGLISGVITMIGYRTYLVALLVALSGALASTVWVAAVSNPKAGAVAIGSAFLMAFMRGLTSTPPASGPTPPAA